MNKIVKSLMSIFLASFGLIGCSSNPAEEYVDYFYSKPVQDGNKEFTYILYLGEKGKSLSQHRKEHSSISPRPESERNQTSPRRATKVKKGEEFTSLSFRMEEEAYRRLDRKLAEKKYCPGEVEFLESEYTWLRYTIKGRCKT
ncbi:MAG: hypothetical protein ABJI60_16165 [Kangiellaceae bacterium]|jgi:hypothetical protein